MCSNTNVQEMSNYAESSDKIMYKMHHSSMYSVGTEQKYDTFYYSSAQIHCLILNALKNRVDSSFSRHMLKKLKVSHECEGRQRTKIGTFGNRMF